MSGTRPLVLHPLVLHVVEGFPGELESIIRKLAVAEADLNRLNTKVTTLEAEIAELRNKRALLGEENPSRMRLHPGWLRTAPTGTTADNAGGVRLGYRG
jgi:ribosomal protein L29